MSPATNPGGNSGVLVPQPHGGALKRGGVNPGAGRRPNRIKRAALKLLEQNMPRLGHIASGVISEWDTEQGKFVIAPATAGESVQALKLLNEVGGGDKVSVGDVKARMRQQIAVIRSRDTWPQDELLARLAEVWR